MEKKENWCHINWKKKSWEAKISPTKFSFKYKERSFLYRGNPWQPTCLYNPQQNAVFVKKGICCASNGVKVISKIRKGAKIDCGSPESPVDMHLHDLMLAKLMSVRRFFSFFASCTKFRCFIHNALGSSKVPKILGKPRKFTIRVQKIKRE